VPVSAPFLRRGALSVLHYRKSSRRLVEHPMSPAFASPKSPAPRPTPLPLGEPRTPPPPLDPKQRGCTAFQVFRDLVSPEQIQQRSPSPAQTVFTSFVTLWLLLLQRLDGGASLDDAVSTLLFTFSPDDLPDCKRLRDRKVSGNNGAYSQARSRLPTELTHWLADEVSHTLGAQSAPPWKGRRVQLLDGTTFSLAPTPELREAFPPASNQYGPSHWPVLHVLVCHDLASGLVCRPEFGPMYGEDGASESSLTRKLLLRLDPYAILLADANFGIFILAYEAARNCTHDVLFRLTAPRFRALRRAGNAVGEGRWEITWQPSDEERQKYGAALPADAEVRGYLVEVRVGPVGKEETLYLFTTLREETNRELGALYGQRWCVETDIAAEKVTLGLGVVQGKSAAMVEKEVVLATVAYNLIVQVRRLAAEKAGVPPRRLSFKGVQSLLKAFQTKIATGNLSEEELQQEFEKLLRASGQRKLPNRPGRKSPRELIPRRRRYPERPRQPEDGSRPAGAGAFDTSPERIQRSPQSRPPKNRAAAAQPTAKETKCP
jgi:hypothetical protein